LFPAQALNSLTFIPLRLPGQRTLVTQPTSQSIDIKDFADKPLHEIIGEWDELSTKQQKQVLERVPELWLKQQPDHIGVYRSPSVKYWAEGFVISENVKNGSVLIVKDDTVANLGQFNLPSVKVLTHGDILVKAKTDSNQTRLASKTFGPYIESKILTNEKGAFIREVMKDGKYRLVNVEDGSAFIIGKDESVSMMMDQENSEKISQILSQEPLKDSSIVQTLKDGRKIVSKQEDSGENIYLLKEDGTAIRLSVDHDSLAVKELHDGSLRLTSVDRMNFESNTYLYIDRFGEVHFNSYANPKNTRIVMLADGTVIVSEKSDSGHVWRFHAIPKRVTPSLSVRDSKVFGF
jgi:hypothetical protein